jgi:hypothetical protein
MNTETTVTPPDAIPAPNIQAINFKPEPKRLHRKIAKLPKALRDIINTSIDDGLPAFEIIQKLNASTDSPLPYPITEVDISRWKSTGYQRYLAHQDHLDSIAASREAALELVRASDNLSLPQATLQVIASQCFEVLADFSPAAIKQKLAEDPLKYTSFLHVFARITREIVHLEKFQEARAAAEAQRAAAQNKAQTDWFEAVKADLSNSPNQTHSTPAPDIQPKQPPAPTTLAPQSVPEIPPPALAQASPPEPVPQLPPAAPEPSRASATPIITEYCLDCLHPLPHLTPEGKRPDERCQNCGVLLPPPGLCTRPSKDACHRCGTHLPAPLPGGRRPRPTCHNCGVGLGRELEQRIPKTPHRTKPIKPYENTSSTLRKQHSPASHQSHNYNSLHRAPTDSPPSPDEHLAEAAISASH